MTFYSIKYLATKGIEQWNGEVSHDKQYASSGSGSGWNGFRFERLGVDAFISNAEALLAGQKRLTRMIASAEKRVAKLKKILTDLRDTSGGA